MRTIFCGGLEEFSSAASDAHGGHPSDFPYVEVTATALALETDACPAHIPISLYALFFPYDWCLSLGERGAERHIVARVRASLARWDPLLASELDVRDVLSPLSLEKEFGMWRGDVDHGSFADGNLLETRGYGRLPHGTTEFRNLFNCSSGIHPGGLVSGRPGLVCAQTVIAGAVNHA